MLWRACTTSWSPPFHSDFELDSEGLRRNVADHARGFHRNMTIVRGCRGAWASSTALISKNIGLW